MVLIYYLLLFYQEVCGRARTAVFLCFLIKRKSTGQKGQAAAAPSLHGRGKKPTRHSPNRLLSLTSCSGSRKGLFSPTSPHPHSSFCLSTHGQHGQQKRSRSLDSRPLSRKCPLRYTPQPPPPLQPPQAPTPPARLLADNRGFMELINRGSGNLLNRKS